MAEKKSDVAPTFEQFIRRLRDRAAAGAEELSRADWSASRWNVPTQEEGGGDLTDINKLSVGFVRDEANQMFIESIRDPANPGRSGDCIVSTVQVDFMAVAERAYRMRHSMQRPRAFLLALGRRQGQANERGPLTTCGLEYVRALVREVGAQA